ncbi:hypothetical protein O6P43_026169 [Quillaja saponaria]|uniref:Uncharacterized protein n=1 Tax=Quillaja saponaria TaxID=32244 RepID=A0AAD7LB62_QUISA|nr:hypothetical protein O6P43_026169 [Quillaja saponaria]
MDVILPAMRTPPFSYGLACVSALLYLLSLRIFFCFACSDNGRYGCHGMLQEMFLLEVFWLDFVFFPHLAVTHVEGAKMFQLLIGAATLLLFDSVVYGAGPQKKLTANMRFC